MRAVVYVVCPDEAALEYARERFAKYDWAQPVLGAFPDVVRERRDDWADAHFVGAVSWDAHMHVALHALPAVLGDVAAADVAALLPCAVGAAEDGAAQHPAFLAAWTRVLTECGFDDAEAASPDIPCFLLNYWLASPSCMDAYLAFHEHAAAALAHEHADVADLVAERLAGALFWRSRAALVLVPLGLARFWEQRELAAPQPAEPESPQPPEPPGSPESSEELTSPP